MPKAKRTSAATQEEGEGDSSQYVDDPSQSTAEVSSAPPAKKAKTGGKAKAVQRSGEVQPFENGVLRALIVENFMNHKHLRIDFDPHVNFIVGKNGSGKSAIVNALIAGFGHKASSTGRNTNSAKSLIMHGKDHALIQIHIANGGPDAYRPHEFGDTIVAEHKLERNGAGYYKLRDGTGGAVRKSSKTEFMELCTHFNIQANNPCALLTQEHAKKFLHHGDEGARYQFFLQAANLESRKHDLNATMQNVELLQSRLARAEAGMAEKKEIARKCQETYDGAKKLKELAAEEETFEALLGWALIGEKEMELEEEEKREAQALEDEERAKAEAEQAHGNQKQLEDEVAKLEREYQKAVDAITKFSASGEKAQKQVTEKLKEVKKAKKHVAALAEELTETEYQEGLADEQYKRDFNALESTQNKAQVEHMRKRQTLQNEVFEHEARLAQLNEKVEELKQASLRSIDEWRGCTKAAELSVQDTKAKIEELAELKKASFDRVHIMHPDMPELLKLIEQHKKQFVTVPVGPLGLNIAIRPEHKALAAAAETAMGGKMLLSFAVHQSGDNKSATKDEQLLRKLMRQVKPRNPKAGLLINLVNVHLRDFGQARFQPARASAGVTRLIDVLDVTAKGAEADIFFNVLMDCAGGESKLLFADEREAQRVVYNSKGSTTAYVREDASAQPRKVFKAGQTTGYETLPRTRMMLVADKKSAIATLEAEAADAKVRSAELTSRAKAADERRKDDEKAEKATRKELKQAENTLTQKQMELDELNGESATDHVTQQLQESEQYLNDLKSRLAKLRVDLERAKRHLEEHEEEAAPLKAKFEEARAKYGEMVAKQTELKEAVEAARAPLKKSQMRRNSVTKELALAQKLQQEAAKAVQSAREWIERMTPSVEESYGPRVYDPHRRTVQQLKDQQKRLQAKIQTQQKKYGGKDLVQLAEEAKTAKLNADAGMADIATVKEMGEKEREAFVERSRFFKKEAKSKGLNANMDFNTRLSRKGHAGKLVFSHDDETLSLSVTRNSQDQNSSGTSDARNLSGGERSFTTLAFELAMWEFCETPFRVLDEFDVYMDDTYRRQAVEVLMELCNQQRERQFLFVTPQDMHPFLQQADLQAMLGPDFRMPRITRMKDVR